jgi:phosphatidylglycerophosphate synthase
MSARTRYGWSEVVSATSRGNLPSAFFERLSVPMTYAIANRTSLSANQVTWAGGLCGLAGCGLFLSGHPLIAASAWFAFAMLDCSDGAIARLRGQASATGADIDLWTDRIVLLAAGLIFSWAFAARGDMLAAWLVQAYLAAHYCTDLGWLMAERLRAVSGRLLEEAAAEHAQQ